MINSIRHTGLVVNNLDMMKEFYGKIGFKIYKEDLEQGKFIETVTGYKKVKLETIKMISGDNSMIELIKYCHPVSEILTPNYKPNQLGCSHIAMTVQNAENTCEIIDQNGGKIINKPVINDDTTVKVAYCFDPEGILLEIVEEL